jgi:uncharacterized membrane protein YbhN (UPF0104 family)
MASNARKKWLLAIKLACSSGLLVYVFKDIDLMGVLGMLSDLSPTLLALACILLLGQTLLAAWRWWLVLRRIGEPLSWGQSWRLFFIGAFFNQLLPSSVGGDAVRAWLAAKEGLSTSGAINGVALERLVAVLSLILLAALAQSVFFIRAEALAIRWIFPPLAAGSGILLLALLFFDKLGAPLMRFAPLRGLARLSMDGRALLLAPWHAARLVVLSLLGHVNMSLTVYLLVAAAGAQASLLDCLVFVPLVTLLTILPISISGWGVREQSMVSLFSLVGMAPAASGTVSVLLGLLTVLTALPGGALWLSRQGKTQAANSAFNRIEPHGHV